MYGPKRVVRTVHPVVQGYESSIPEVPNGGFCLSVFLLVAPRERPAELLWGGPEPNAERALLAGCQSVEFAATGSNPGEEPLAERLKNRLGSVRLSLSPGREDPACYDPPTHRNLARLPEPRLLEHA